MGKRNPWQGVIDEARAIVQQGDVTVVPSDHDYEIATIKGEGLSLVIYPHKTTAGHRHARVRNNNSKNTVRAREVITSLIYGKKTKDGQTRFDCTFHCKTMP